MGQSVVTCPGCKRRTPSRHGKCVYCQARLPVAPAPGSAEAAHEEPRMLGAGKARFVRQGDDRFHYLVTDFQDPVTVEPGKLFVIGRDPHTSLVVRAMDVSRQHAEIDWESEPPRPILREVRSATGTFLNDKRVERDDPQPLRSGDRIRLGAATVLQYLHVTPRDLEKELEDRGRRETRALDPQRLQASLGEPVPAAGPSRAPRAPARASPARPTPAPLRPAAPAPQPEAGGESGSFEQLAPTALMKRLHDERASGVLTFFAEGSAPGEVVLVEGRCKDAIFGLYSGRDAVEVMAVVEGGAYRFRREDPDRLRLSPPAAETDARGLALSGFLEPDFPGESLLQDLVGERASGVLTVWDGVDTAEVVLRVGICQASAYGGLGGREALDAVRALLAGAYRFRPEPPADEELPATQPVRAADLRPGPRPPTGAQPRRPGPPSSGSGRVPAQPGPPSSERLRPAPPGSDSGRLPATRPVPPPPPRPNTGRPGPAPRRPDVGPSRRPPPWAR